VHAGLRVGAAIHAGRRDGALAASDALKGAEWQVCVRAYDGRLGRIGEAVFAGSGSVRSPQKVGHFRLAFEQTETAPLFVVSEVLLNGRPADRTFYWLNYEFDKGCLFRLPQTRLGMRVNGNEVVVKNEGELPAAAVNVARPGHLDSFRASDNFFWLDAGEEHTIAVNEPDGLTVEAWNACLRADTHRKCRSDFRRAGGTFFP
jgi:beta-mannosidase